MPETDRIFRFYSFKILRFLLWIATQQTKKGTSFLKLIDRLGYFFILRMSHKIDKEKVVP